MVVAVADLTLSSMQTSLHFNVIPAPPSSRVGVPSENFGSATELHQRDSTLMT